MKNLQREHRHFVICGVENNYKKGIDMLIKICGLTNEKEAEFLNTTDTDFAGMVLFFEKSKRNISLDTAKKIIGALSDEIKKVAVVVAPTISQIEDICKCGFDYVQIHGEVDETILNSSPLPILKAFNVNDLDKIDYYERFDKIAGYVFDAAEPGSGKTFDWRMLRDIRHSKLFFLAGGLTADNVGKAIKTASPDGVDVSSGVEYEERPGKDPDKIIRFIENVRNA